MKSPCLHTDTNTHAPANTPKNKQRLHPTMEAHKWKSGESGNRSGRPKRKPITELYEQILNDPEAMAELQVSIRRALKRGQMAMFLQLKEMMDRVEGKVTQPIEADVTVNLADAIAAARKRANRAGFTCM
jgi:hypothetical protein